MNLDSMSLVHLVILVAFLQYMWFGWEVGAMRGKHKVSAPATTGNPEFERMFRVHQNTLEQLVVFVPALMIFASYLDARWAAGIGAVFIVGRTIYRLNYLDNPQGRGLGFGLGFASVAVLVLGGIFGAVRAML